MLNIIELDSQGGTYAGSGDTQMKSSSSLLTRQNIQGRTCSPCHRVVKKRIVIQDRELMDSQVAERDIEIGTSGQGCGQTVNG